MRFPRAEPIPLLRRRGRTGPLSSCGWGALVPLGGCSSAPSQNILGSFFPAWLICSLIGVIAAAVVHKVLLIVGIGEHVPAPALTYTTFAAVVTMVVWLLWVGNAGP